MGRTKWIARLTIFAACATATTAAADPNERVMLKVLVQDGVGLSAQTLHQAREQATRIFAHAGIELSWVTNELPESRYVVINIVSGPFGRKSRDISVMGVAAGAMEGKGTLAYIFYDRIRHNGEYLNLPVSVLMGHVIAHEIGHLLLSYGYHSAGGLMKGGWDERQALLARQQALTFSHVEIARLKTRLAP